LAANTLGTVNFSDTYKKIPIISEKYFEQRTKGKKGSGSGMHPARMAKFHCPYTCKNVFLHKGKD